MTFRVVEIGVGVEGLGPSGFPQGGKKWQQIKMAAMVAILGVETKQNKFHGVPNRTFR